MKVRDRELCVLDSAVVSLLDGVTIEPAGLRDIDGTLQVTNSVGRFIATAIQKPATVAAVVDMMVERYGMDRQRARADLVIYLGDLDLRRLISVRQSYWAESLLRIRQAFWSLASMVLLQFRQNGVRYPSRRYRPSAGRVLASTVEAHQPTVIGGALLILAITTLGVVRSIRLGIPMTNALSLLTFAILICYVLGLVASGGLHELGHYLAARRLRVPVLSVFVRMGSAGLSHVDVSPGTTALVALAGPLCGAAVPIALMAGSWYMPASWLGPLAIPNAHLAVTMCWACVAALQLRSLTPFTAEGRRLLVSLVQAVARRRTPAIAGGAAR